MRSGVMFIVYAIYILTSVIVFLNSCTHTSRYTDPTGSNYPADVAAIFLNKCAVSGCHNDLSYANAGGLNLSTWDKLFNGSSTGAVVIPYRPDFSSLCFFTNTDSSLGIVLRPTMPYDRTPLSKAEYLKLRDWIATGAPGFNRQIKFADAPARKKFYVANRLCDVVTVVDAVAMIQMRYIDVGTEGTDQYPYCVQVSPDKRHWYVSFFSQSHYVQQFSAEDDKLAGNIDLGTGMWTSFVISSDSRYGWFVDNSSVGKVVYADLQSRAVLASYTFGGHFKYPSGIALNEQLKKLYVGATNGNFVYVVDIANPMLPVVHELPVDGTGVVKYESALGATELLYNQQTNRCYVGCVASGEVRVLDMMHDSLVGVIGLSSLPAGMYIWSDKLFVACPDDVASFPGNRGAVVVIDLHTNTVLKKIKTGYQPYDIAIDEERMIAAVVNANISSSGPASHHVSGCGNKNGNVTFIDLNTMELLPRKQLEVAVFPFSVSAR